MVSFLYQLHAFYIFKTFESIGDSDYNGLEFFSQYALLSLAFAFQQNYLLPLFFHKSKVDHVAIMLVPLWYPGFAIMITRSKWIQKKTLKKLVGFLVVLSRKVAINISMLLFHYLL